jgi:hypothetical protein
MSARSSRIVQFLLLLALSVNCLTLSAQQLEPSQKLDPFLLIQFFRLEVNKLEALRQQNKAAMQAIEEELNRVVKITASESEKKSVVDIVNPALKSRQKLDGDLEKSMSEYRQVISLLESGFLQMKITKPSPEVPSKATVDVAPSIGAPKTDDKKTDKKGEQPTKK